MLRRTLLALCAATIATASAARAESAPPTFQGDPDVYKVIFEDHVEVGYNYRMTDIQAAVGVKQLEHIGLTQATLDRRTVQVDVGMGLGNLEDSARRIIDADGHESTLRRIHEAGLFAGALANGARRWR